MTYLLGALAGLILGGIVGLFKNLFLWHGCLKKSAFADDAAAGLGGIYARVFISHIVNIITLVIAFFIREVVPFDGIIFLIATAVALSIMNKVLVMHQKKIELMAERKRKEASA